MNWATQTDDRYIPDCVRVTGKAEKKCSHGRKKKQRVRELSVMFKSETGELLHFKSRKETAEFFGITANGISEKIKTMRSRSDAAGTIGGVKYFLIETDK